LTVIRTDRVPGRSFSYPAAFGDGRYALNASMYSGEQVGQPVHIVSPDGRVLRSFGGGRGLGSEYALIRVVSVARDSTLWVTHPSTYRIERWDSTGHLLAVYERRADWFRAYDAGIPPRAGSPRVVSAREDAAGLLWVKLGIMDSAGIENIIEVLDPKTLRVVASARFLGPSTPLIGVFLHSTMKELPDGQPVLKVWGYRLRR
jgi:hypothetical protein